MSKLIQIGSTEVFSESNSIYWQGPLAVDADGSPWAYHPNCQGLDATANAGHPGDWWGLVVGKDGNPIIQTANDPAPGYYVSTTALQDHTKLETDPRRYVNSSTVPYLAVPPELLRASGARMGDLAAVTYNGIVVSCILADVGPHGKLGEGSCALSAAFIALAEQFQVGGLPCIVSASMFGNNTISFIFYLVGTGSVAANSATLNGFQVKFVVFGAQ